MKCPKCGSDNDKVLDSRAVREGAAIRRRREVTVVKRDGTREPFSRAKVEKGVRTACRKRPVSEDQVQNILDEVVVALDGEEVSAARIGELVMERLHKIDEVAYIRFASVYKRFSDVNEFLQAVTEMAKE